MSMDGIDSHVNYMCSFSIYNNVVTCSKCEHMNQVRSFADIHVRCRRDMYMYMCLHVHSCQVP